MNQPQEPNQHRPGFALGFFFLLLILLGALLLARVSAADRVFPPTPAPALPETGSGFKPSCGCFIFPTPATDQTPTPPDGN